MGYFKFKEQRVFYQIIGEGKPMVLQHGYMQWGDDWHYAGWSKHLSKNYKLIIIDSIGHGRSSNSEKIVDYTIEHGVELTIKLMDFLNIGKFDFFGFSMGGRIAFQISSDHSDRIDKILAMMDDVKSLLRVHFMSDKSDSSSIQQVEGKPNSVIGKLFKSKK